MLTGSLALHILYMLTCLHCNDWLEDSHPWLLNYCSLVTPSLPPGFHARSLHVFQVPGCSALPYFPFAFLLDRTDGTDRSPSWTPSRSGSSRTHALTGLSGGSLRGLWTLDTYLYCTLDLVSGHTSRVLGPAWVSWVGDRMANLAIMRRQVAPTYCKGTSPTSSDTFTASTKVTD